ncbi:MAG: hypothetical protein C4309_12575, partial [Chloroflexota bacterium]
RHILRQVTVLELGQNPGEAEPATPPDGLRLRGEVTRLDRGTEYTLNLIPLGGFVRPRGEDDPRVVGGLAG